MADEDLSWRQRMLQNRDDDRAELDGFFESRRGRIFLVVIAAIGAIAFGWTMIQSIIASFFGG